MSEPSVQQTVFEIIAREATIDVEKITLESTLKDLEIESLEALEIVFEIEQKFNITMPDRDPQFDTATVRGLVEAVENALRTAPPATPPAA